MNKATRRVKKNSTKFNAFYKTFVKLLITWKVFSFFPKKNNNNFLLSYV